MIFSRLKQKLKYYLHWQKYQEQKLFYADTVQMPRFWVAMVAGGYATYRIGDAYQLRYDSPWIFPIAIFCVLLIFIVLDRILDWIFPIS